MTMLDRCEKCGGSLTVENKCAFTSTPLPFVPWFTVQQGVRYLNRTVIGSDDTVVPITITYPSPLRPHEIDDLEELFALLIRQQRRLSQSESAQ